MSFSSGSSYAVSLQPATEYYYNVCNDKNNKKIKVGNLDTSINFPGMSNSDTIEKNKTANTAFISGCASQNGVIKRCCDSKDNTIRLTFLNGKIEQTTGKVTLCPRDRMKMTECVNDGFPALSYYNACKNNAYPDCDAIPASSESVTTSPVVATTAPVTTAPVTTASDATTPASSTESTTKQIISGFFLMFAMTIIIFFIYYIATRKTERLTVVEQ